MSSESDHPGRFGRLGTETTAAHATDPDPVDASTSEWSRHREADDGQPVSGTRTRIVSLKAEVELLEAERETLANQVLTLEADVAELEEEVATLEGAVEREEQRRQQVIDKYESIIAERSEANQELREGSTATTEEGTWPLPVIKSSAKTVCTRMKRLITSG